MTTNFPTSVDSFPDPLATDRLDNPPHDVLHTNVNSAVEAIETALLDGAPLHIDDANERVGIGTTTPESALEVNGVLTANHIHGNIAGAVYLHVKNTSGVTIPAGSPVYATGSVGASGATEVAISDADNASTMPALGIVDEELVDNAEGHATVLGVAKGLDTSGYSVNDSLYVSTSGGLTNVRPTGASELVQKIGRVIRADASTGEILVLGAGRSNDVPNNVVAGGLTIDTDTLHVDSTNNRVGIGTASPEDSLHVRGNAQVVELEGTDHVYVGFYPDGHAAGRKAYVGFGGTDPHFYVTNQDTGNLYASSGSSSISLLSNGNIGINNTSPSFPLDVNGTGRFAGELNIDGGFVKIGASDTNEGGELQLLKATSYTQNARIDNYADTVRFMDNTTVRATLGLTNGNFTITGSSYSVGGIVSTGSAGGESPFYVTRGGDTGQSMKMYTNDRQSFILAVQDETTGTTSLHLGVDSSTPTGGKVLYIQNCEMQILDGRILPSPDATRDLGASSLRWNTVFAASGSINTSDVRDKTDINDLDYGLQFVNNLRPVSYKFNDRCGYVGTRTHMGFIAQEVASVLGGKAVNMGVWTNSAGEVDAEGNEFELERQGLRYDELIAPMVKAIQELTARIEALETL